MPVDPILQPLLAALPPAPAEIDDFDAYRKQEDAAGDAMIEQVSEPAPEGAQRRVLQIPVDGGSIDLHVFTPSTNGPHPVHLYLHGGGWIAGTVKSKYIDILGSERAVGADCVVVAVEYRKAPEHKFPTGLNDCYAALLWVADHAEELNIRGDVITVGGGSAGANLAAALTLKVRDEGGPRITLQVLEVPALDLTMSAPSLQRHATGYGLTRASAEMCVRQYLYSPQDASNPYASPLLSPDLAGLPSAYILSAEYDPLCDDGEAYAKRLTDAGVPTTFSLQEGQIHVSSALTKILPAARAWRDEVMAALRSAHEQGAS